MTFTHSVRSALLPTALIAILLPGCTGAGDVTAPAAGRTETSPAATAPQATTTAAASPTENPPRPAEPLTLARDEVKRVEPGRYQIDTDSGALTLSVPTGVEMSVAPGINDRPGVMLTDGEEWLGVITRLDGVVVNDEDGYLAVDPPETVDEMQALLASGEVWHHDIVGLEETTVGPHDAVRFDAIALDGYQEQQDLDHVAFLFANSRNLEGKSFFYGVEVGSPERYWFFQDGDAAWWAVGATLDPSGELVFPFDTLLDTLVVD